MKLMIEHNGQLAFVADLDIYLDFDSDGEVQISDFDAPELCDDIAKVASQVKKGIYFNVVD